jgi:putative endonuclease
MMLWLLQLADKARHRARMRLWAPSQASGRRGEDLAHRFLQRLGFSIVARNFRSRSGSGEIDLIAWDGDTLVFAEVKSLSSDTYSAPDRAIDRLKQELVVRTAIDYVRRSAAPWNRVRFDTINVLLDHPPRILLRRDAFPPPAALRRAS